jgi:HSP20 family protein
MSRALTTFRSSFPSLFDDFFKPWNEWPDTDRPWNRTLVTPAVNITESTNDYLVSVAAPGLKKSDFKINVEKNMLTISSETENREEKKDENYTREEYNYSSFSRSFTLPDEVNKEKIDASYTDGVLKIVLPKNEGTKKVATTKQIAVK